MHSDADVPALFWRRRVLTVLLMVLVASTLARAALDAGLLMRRVTVSNIRPEVGKAFVGALSDPDLSDDRAPSGAILYLYEPRKGGFIHRYGKMLGGMRTMAWLKGLYEARFPNATYEMERALGPSGSQHADIREGGDGRYSVWHGGVYFSLPARTSLGGVPHVELRVPIFPALSDPALVAQWQSWLAMAAICAALGVLLWPAAAWLVRFRWTAPLVGNVLPGLVISAVLVAVVGAGLEFYLRATGYFPKEENTWSSQFVPGLGFQMAPGAEIKQSNGVSFAVIQRTNSLGFLDREPRIPKPQGTFRILLVGDSMIEAVQVPVEQKMQSVLAELLKQRFPTRDMDVVAIGHSGTGQANQLGFYRHYKERIRPDLVVLLFVGNDFANNSPLLESIRFGWHPDHLPWWFPQKKQGGECALIPPSAESPSHRLPGGSESEGLKNFRERFPELASELAGWDPDKVAMDFVFYESAIPPAFQDAVDLTRCAFAFWKKEAEGDGVPIVVMSAQQVAGIGHLYNPPHHGQIIRLKSILGELGLPLLDLYEATAKYGSWRDAELKYDGHLNPKGHRWAAAALLEFLIDKKCLVDGKDTAKEPQAGHQTVYPSRIDPR